MSHQAESILNSGELLVYRYIEEESKKHGSVNESVDAIAENILHRYSDQIRPRKRKDSESGETSLVRSFSGATVSRALSRLKEQGIIQVTPSEESSSLPNTIHFFGFPDEEEEVSSILDMAKNLSLSVARFETILRRKDEENHKLLLEKKQLYKELDLHKEEVRRLNELVQSLQTDLKKAMNGAFGEGTITQTIDLGDGQRAYVLKE